MTEGIVDDPRQRRFLPPLYIADRDFRQMINGATVAYKKGATFRDRTQVDALLAQSAPISEVLDEADLCVCPHCQMSFSMKIVRGAEELRRRARSLMPGVV
jgi:hypothetical protein